MDNSQEFLCYSDWALLRMAAKRLEPWFEIDKVKSYAVYVWTKDEIDYNGENVFDIYKDYLQFYQCTKPWEMPNEVWEIIKEIQELLEE